MKRAYFYVFLLCLLTSMSCSSEDDELEDGLHPRRKDTITEEKTYAAGDFSVIHEFPGLYAPYVRYPMGTNVILTTRGGSLKFLCNR